MAAEIVDDDDAARLERRDQELLDPGGEALAIDRSIDHAGCDDAVMPQAGDEGQRLPMAVRDLGDERLALVAPSVGPRHIGFRPGLINEHQALGVYVPLEREPAGAASGNIRTVLLLGEECLFLNVLPMRLR